MNFARWCNLTVFTWSIASACPAVTQTDAPGRPPHDNELVQEAVPASVRLPPLPGFADDAGFLASVTSRVDELRQQAGDALNAARKAGFLLAAANLILAEQLEPACSRKFLFMRESIFAPDQPPQGDDALAAASALDRADTLLAEAEILLRTEQERSTDEDPPLVQESMPTPALVKELNRSVITLKAFAQALRVYLVDLPGPALDAQGEMDTDPSRIARRAASNLSVILEDDNPRIAAAAAFWQACLRAMEPDPAPAFDMLDRAIVDLPTDAPRFGFYSRLLRCRLVAGRGGTAAALALLMQIEERIGDWFKADSDRADAIRSCAWLRLQTLQDWHDRLDPTSQADERTWCKSRIESLRTERFSESSGATVLRLNQAIPLIARPPEPEATPPDGSPAPP